jgi:hypothetical protein
MEKINSFVRVIIGDVTCDGTLTNRVMATRERQLPFIIAPYMDTSLLLDSLNSDSARLTSPHCTSTRECKTEVSESDLTVEMDQRCCDVRIILDTS